MHKILLATTALVASSGFAMAGGHISFSGAADAGYGQDKDGGDAEFYSSANFKVSMTGSTDGGTEFGLSMDASAGGQDYDQGDFDLDGSESGEFGLGDIWISSGGFTISFDHDGKDDLADDAVGEDHDVSVAFSQGGISLEATIDGEGDGTTSDSSMSFKGSFDGGAFNASVAGNDADCTVIGAGYSSGAFSIGVESASTCGGSSEVNTVTVGYAQDAFDISVEASDDDSWEVGVGYSDGGLSIGATIAEDSSGNQSTELMISQDLGGGLSLEAGARQADTDTQDAYYVGAKMSF